jgi:hypothetical protein
LLTEVPSTPAVHASHREVPMGRLLGSVAVVLAVLAALAMTGPIR